MRSLATSRVARGFALAILAGLIFQGLNATVKVLVLELPPLQVAWLRWLAGILWIAPFALDRGLPGLRSAELRLHAARGLFHGGGYALWYSAVGLVPLATTAALSFTGPLFVTLGAAVFLGERVRRERWLGVGIGFAGVLVILRPGLGEANLGSLLMLASVPLIAGSNLIAKVVSGRDSPQKVVFWQSVFAAVLFAPAGLWLWVTPDGGQLALAAAAGLLGTAAYFCLTWAYRLLDISALQPIAFLGIVWASLADLMLFGATADAWTFIGAAIVVAAGALLVRREAANAKR